MCWKGAAALGGVLGGAFVSGCGWTARDEFLERRQVFIQADARRTRDAAIQPSRPDVRTAGAANRE